VDDRVWRSEIVSYKKEKVSHLELVIVSSQSFYKRYIQHLIKVLKIG
jgi:hypothetical protein